MLQCIYPGLLRRKIHTAKVAYFLCLQGAHERGIRFLLRTTLKWPSGECGVLDEVVEDGVGAISEKSKAGSVRYGRCLNFGGGDASALVGFFEIKHREVCYPDWKVVQRYCFSRADRSWGCARVNSRGLRSICWSDVESTRPQRLVSDR